MAEPFARTFRQLELRDQLQKLLNDYGYYYAEPYLIVKKVPGFSHDAIQGIYHKGIWDAAERICPIIAEKDFTTRLTAITSPKEVSHVPTPAAPVKPASPHNRSGAKPRKVRGANNARQSNHKSRKPARKSS